MAETEPAPRVRKPKPREGIPVGPDTDRHEQAQAMSTEELKQHAQYRCQRISERIEAGDYVKARGDATALCFQVSELANRGGFPPPT